MLHYICCPPPSVKTKGSQNANNNIFVIICTVFFAHIIKITTFKRLYIKRKPFELNIVRFKSEIYE